MSHNAVSMTFIITLGASCVLGLFCEAWRARGIAKYQALQAPQSDNEENDQ